MSKRVLANITFVVSGIVFGFILTPLLFRVEEITENALIFILFNKFGVDWITSYFYANVIEFGIAAILLIPTFLLRKKFAQFRNPKEIQKLETWKIVSSFLVIGLLFSFSLLGFALFTLGFVTSILTHIVL